MRQKRKPNVRSFRYSNECADILATYGNDLDAFVLDAYLRLPETHEQVRMELETLRELESEAHRIRANIKELQLTAQFLLSMQMDIAKLSSRLDDIASGRVILSTTES